MFSRRPGGSFRDGLGRRQRCRRRQRADQRHLFDQGLLQVLQGSVAGLEPRRPYVLELSTRTDGGGPIEALASFMTNPAGAAIVNAVGPIRQVVQSGADAPRRYLVVAPRAAPR